MVSSISDAFSQRPPRVFALVFAATIPSASGTQTAEIGGVRFPASLQMGEAQLKQRGAGLLRRRSVAAVRDRALHAQPDDGRGEIQCKRENSR